MATVCEKACAILAKTCDGDDLAPTDLKLLELAVNDALTDLGKQAFDELHTTVTSGTYRAPWFHGIEHLTINHEGFIYWKGDQVEHFNVPWAYSDEGQEAAEDTARRCKHLEQLGVEVTCRNVVWDWDRYADATP